MGKLINILLGLHHLISSLPGLALRMLVESLFFMNYVRTNARSSLQYFIWLKSKRE